MSDELPGPELGFPPVRNTKITVRSSASWGPEAYTQWGHVIEATVEYDGELTDPQLEFAIGNLSNGLKLHVAAEVDLETQVNDEGVLVLIFPKRAPEPSGPAIAPPPQRALAPAPSGGGGFQRGGGQRGGGFNRGGQNQNGRFGGGRNGGGGGRPFGGGDRMSPDEYEMLWQQFAQNQDDFYNNLNDERPSIKRRSDGVRAYLEFAPDWVKAQL